jgi:hypothetical protein
VGRDANAKWYYIEDNPDPNSLSLTSSEHMIINAQASKVRCTERMTGGEENSRVTTNTNYQKTVPV